MSESTIHTEPLRLTIACQGPLVAGFPQWVEVELANPDPNLSVAGVPGIELDLSCPALSLVARADEQVVAALGPRHPADFHGIVPGESLGPGQRRASLLELDAELSLPPGVYEIELVYPATNAFAHAKVTFALELLEPSPDEREVLRRRDVDGWMLTTLCEARRLPLGPDAASERSHEQLRLHDRLHAAIWRRGLSGLEVAELFAALPKRFDPAAALLGYELGLLEGAPPGTGVRESLLARWPGWTWWLAAVDAGRGPLARMRARQAMLTANPDSTGC